MPARAFERGHLQIEEQPADGATPVCLVWKGVSSDVEPGEGLGQYLTEVLKEAIASARGVEMRFDGMEYASSSTLASIIAFTQEALEAGVKLRYVFDRTRRWQKLSFDALRVFDTGEGLLELKPA